MRNTKIELGILSAAMTTGEIVSANEPPKLPLVPAPRVLARAPSIRERIEVASSTSEVDLLLSRALSFKKISPRTLRQIESAALIRKFELGGLQ